MSPVSRAHARRLITENNANYCSPCSQLVKNCRTGKGDEALSFWFLMLWLLGDSANLIGALLTKQLATEVGGACFSSIYII